MWKLRRRRSGDNLNEEQPLNAEQRVNIIQQTRKIACQMSQKQRFVKAKKHLEDALQYRTPRPDTYKVDLSMMFKIAYNIQTSKIWSWLLFMAGYVNLYLVILDTNHAFSLKLLSEVAILGLFWTDLALETYHKLHETLRIESRFPPMFYWRIVVLGLLVMDEVIFCLATGQRPIRPFRLLRATLPMFYDSFIRKSFQALFSCYKDIIVYLMFYTMIIVGFSIVGNQIIQIPPGTHYDNFKENYIDLEKIIFVIYVMSSYDSYPDNQHIALQSSIYNYAFFIGFIIFNVFFFVVIPATLIFNSFRQIRSKILLVDQIKQKHSLILCFVSLGQDNLSISHKKLVQFLLYIYKGKIRYIDHITEVCLKLDQNNNGQIQINQFLQLCKILQANSSMMPPRFHDWQWWFRFRNLVNENLKLRKIVLSDYFRIFNALFIITTFINCCLCLFTDEEIFGVLDNFFMLLFVAEVLLKLIGLGVEEYFQDKWNTLDFWLILMGLVIQIIPKHLQPHNSDVLFKMSRIFRITTLLKLVFHVKTIEKQNDIYRKIRQLLGQMTIIVPIVLKFFPLFMITYFVFGIVGMECFYGSTKITPEQSPYSFYDKHSNFKSFMATQFIMVQVLVEAGWSLVAFDHAYRYGNYLLTMLYFVSCHMITVLILSALMKGLVWEVYYTVHQQYQRRNQQQEITSLKLQKLTRKQQEYEQIKAHVEGKLFISPDTVIKKYLYETKIDLQILAKIKSNYFKKFRSLKSVKSSDIRTGSQRKLMSRKSLVSYIVKDKQIKLEQIDFKQSSQDFSQSVLLGMIVKQEIQQLNQETQSVTESLIDDYMERILTKLIMNPKVKYSESIVYPALFVEFLNLKLKSPGIDNLEYNSTFDLSQNPLGSKESLHFLEYQMNVLLGIQRSRREERFIIIKSMAEQGLIKDCDLRQISRLKNQLHPKDEGIDVNWVIRKMFLGDTNEALMRKFQVEYFSNIYGKSFREINKVTIEPLLRYEATLTYCLRNLLRYPHTTQTEFFTILSTIEESISNKLLKTGSLFKFVYQLDPAVGSGQNWFSIEFKKETKEVKVHFIKSGLWISEKSLHNNQIKHAKDVFNWQNMSVEQIQRKTSQQLIKLFYQGFQTLAYCLSEESQFFTANPKDHIYDLYSFYTDVSEVSRSNKRIESLDQLENQMLPISKVMLVILSKQEQRSSSLPYDLTDIKNGSHTTEVNKSIKNKLKFKFDQTQTETLEKLKKMSVLDHEKIIDAQGLPHAFILNLITQVRDLLKLYPQNLVNSVQKVFDMHFANINLTSPENRKYSNERMEQEDSQVTF